MAAQEEIKQVAKEENSSFLKSQEARVIMYVIPTAIILTIIAYLLK